MRHERPPRRPKNDISVVYENWFGEERRQRVHSVVDAIELEAFIPLLGMKVIGREVFPTDGSWGGGMLRWTS